MLMRVCKPGDLLLTLLAVVLLWAPVGAAAKNIYKFQDENGIWHFTDRVPDEDIQYEAIYMEREPEPRITMRQEGTKQNPVYSVFNDFWGPAQIELSLLDAVNVISEPELPARFVVPGQTERTLVGIGAMDPKRGFQFRLNMASVPGRPISQPVEGVVLVPPFAAGEEYPVSQGFNGGKTHTTPDSQYAIDIVMPVGTEILAARGGIVMDVEEDFNSGGTNRKKFVDKANHVRILHDDGTMALYAHLDLASVSVRPGARVRAGDRIARSGNTGFSSGPHLHFALQQNTGMKLISIPFRFQAPDGSLFEPEQNMILQGVSMSH
ncbi:MAG: peptidoglycan DD-metalloendopeptidase family protein [Lysobacterales bacterium]|jgi:murein DD-endopeptidase MepM/ murein hydrolase activator NlpD